LFLVVALQRNTVAWGKQVFEDIDNPLRIKKMAGSETLYVSQAPVFFLFFGYSTTGSDPENPNP